MNSKYISDYVYLAEASYADFSGTNFNIIKEVNDAIVSTNPKKPTTKQFADLVTQNYTVEVHWKDRAEKASDPESGFSATLFKGTEKSGQEANYIPALDFLIQSFQGALN